MYDICVCKELTFGSLDDTLLRLVENADVCNHTATYLSTLNLSKIYSKSYSTQIDRGLVDTLSSKVAKK